MRILIWVLESSKLAVRLTLEDHFGDSWWVVFEGADDRFLAAIDPHQNDNFRATDVIDLRALEQTPPHFDDKVDLVEFVMVAHQIAK